MALPEPDAGRTRAGLVWLAAPASWLRVLVPPAPLNAAEALATYPKALAVLDGAMFEFCAGEPHDYARYRCARLDYGVVDPRTGTSVPSVYPSRGGTLVVEGGSPVAYAGWHSPPPGALAWQGYPVLVDRGVTESFTHGAERTERAAVGFLPAPDGRIVFATMVASMQDFARALAALGLHWAAYSDGGGSTALVVRDGDRLLEDRPGNARARRVASFLALSPETTRAW